MVVIRRLTPPYAGSTGTDVSVVLRFLTDPCLQGAHVYAQGDSEDVLVEGVGLPSAVAA